MNIQIVLKEMIPFLVLFPSAVLCYLPMKHQLRFPARKLFFLIAAALCLYIPIAAWCKVVFASSNEEKQWMPILYWFRP